MTTDIAIIPLQDDAVLAELQRIENRLPALLQAASQKTRHRFIDFITSSIRNPNTRAAYQRAILQFLNWCEDDVRVAGLYQIKPIVIAAYLEQMEAYAAKPTKQHRSAISKMFDWLVAGNVGLDVNLASAVRGPSTLCARAKPQSSRPRKPVTCSTA